MNMRQATKSEFEAFISANCPLHVQKHPRKEADHEAYENHDGEEVAAICWEQGRSDRTLTYFIADSKE